MIKTDSIALLTVQAALVVLAIAAARIDSNVRAKSSTAAVDIEVRRGEKSMSILYTLYGAALASCLVLIDKATGIEGNKVVLIILDFFCLTYLFFFSTWFRNSIIFPIAERIRKD